MKKHHRRLRLHCDHNGIRFDIVRIPQKDSPSNGWLIVSSRTFPTPYILYTGYEIEKGQLVTANGKVKCSTTTATSQFSQAHAVAYSGNPSVDWAGAGNGGGPIPAAFLQAEGILSCSPGTYRGLPTLEVVVGTYTDVYAVSRLT
jgi:hypothetical protein